jgi:hypothetical protein
MRVQELDDVNRIGLGIKTLIWLHRLVG